MTLAAGTRLGRYEIQSLLGAGGMGEVYLARDTKLGREVAVKVLPEGFARDAERLARFEQEACAAGALNHPNILSVYDVGQEDSTPYVVSELLEGQTLRELMNGARLSQHKATEYGTQIARGLAAAHERGIFHRDLKPENIFITDDGRAKILDFGLAKLAGAPDTGQLQTDIPTRRVETNPGVVMGTLGYMSPEQVRGQKADHRSDIFSFGCVLYEMLSGRRAFGGESVADMMSAILREDPPELSLTNRTVSPALERLVRHCLEKSPSERFQSARDLAFALESLSNTSGSDATVAPLNSGASVAQRPASVWRGKIAGMLPWIASVSALALALVFAGLYMRRDPAAEARTIHASILFPENSSGPLHAALSPDGHLLAFTAVKEGRRTLWVRPVAAAEAQALLGTEGAAFPFWSADSRSIGFFAEGKLKRIEATGGPVLNVCDAPRGRGGTWNRDGLILFTPDTRDPIHRVAASGGAAEPVTQIDSARAELTHRWPHFLPDGRHFLYFVRSAGAEAARHTGIFVGSLNAKGTRLVVNNASNPVYAAPGHLLFVREGNLMAQGFDERRLETTGEPVALARGVSYNRNWDVAEFSASANGILAYRLGTERQSQLVWLDRTGKQMGAVGEPGYYDTMRLSPDGQRVAVSIVDPVRREGDIWLLETARANATRFTFSPAPYTWPVWSPDGSRIVFGSERSGVADLYQKSVAGTGGEEEVLKSNYYKSPGDWSADGRYLAYTVIDPKTGWDIWILPLFGDRRPFQFVNTPFNESECKFSPDGRWLAYESNETGRDEIYVQAFPGPGAKQQVSSGGGFEPRWGAGGRELYYVAPDGKKLLAVEVKAGPVFETGAAKTLFEVPAGIHLYDAPADGRRFLIATPVGEERTPTITLVLNWAAGLKR